MFRTFLTLFGTFLLTASLQAEPIRLPDGQVLAEVDFERHVHALLDRQGCNAGACHGSSRGRGSFVLSLIGESPERDYQVLTRSSRGRLLHYAAPDQSLLLQRPLGMTGHAGKQRLQRGSWEYEVLRQWVAAGAPWQRDSGKIVRIEVEPARIVFAGLKETRSLKVFVQFADGSRHDMTNFCDFRHPDEKVLSVTRQGEVTSLDSGVDTVLVAYRGHITPVPVAVANPPLAEYPPIPGLNYIDREVFARLRELHVAPADLSSDAEFLRRLHIDTIGSLPTPEEIRAFIASKAPDKRVRKIDELLAHPRHAALWANKWLAWTGNSTDGQPPFHHGMRGWRQLWFEWLRQRFENNVPFDQLVEGIVCADSREGKTSEAWLRDAEELVSNAAHGFGGDYDQRRTLDLFWRSFEYPYDPAERIASAFLGIRLDCARCHKHPLGPWTPTDHQAFTDVFRGVRHGNSPEFGPLAQQELTRRQKELKVLDVWRSALKEIYLGDREPNQKPMLPGGLDLSGAVDARRDFLHWLVAPENPYFARNIVNRTWAHYFGRGLIEPIDGFADANLPSHPQLLDLLAQDFTTSGFDLRRLERIILQSRTYQLAFVETSKQKSEPTLFGSRQPTLIPRRIQLDMICDAVGHALQLDNVPAGKRAIEIADLQAITAYVQENDDWKERDEALLRLFGRTEAMDRCNLAPELGNYLHLMGYSAIPELVRKGQRVKALAAWTKGEDEMIDEMFLSILSRWPRPEERAAIRKHLASHRQERAGAIEDVYWALINTREFGWRR